MIFTYLSSKIN